MSKQLRFDRRALLRGSVSRHLSALLGVLCLSATLSARAEVFPLPPAGDDIVGEVRTIIVASDEDTLIDIARRNGLGYDEIRNANPAVDSWMPKANTQVTIPSRYLLPVGPREGVVINVAEMRLYYFPKPKPGQPAMVETFPVSIGRGNWSTPIVTTKISRKVVDPVWYPPKSIRAEHAADGDHLPDVVKAGPDNPLGKYALHMSLPSYLIHGTNKEFGIGMQVTHGCIRMYPEDIERMFKEVPVGTPVRIVNQPYKAGWHQGVLYLEVHPLLDGTPDTAHRDKTPLTDVLVAATKNQPGYSVNWDDVRDVDIEARGMPVPVGPVLPPAVNATYPPEDLVTPEGQ